MARRWTDPRDGLEWVVEAMPFDMGPPPEPQQAAVMGWTVIFASPKGHREVPVGYDLGVNVARLKDRELIVLLDAAQR